MPSLRLSSSRPRPAQQCPRKQISEGKLDCLYMRLLWLHLTKDVFWVMQHALVIMKNLAVIENSPNALASMGNLRCI